MVSYNINEYFKILNQSFSGLSHDIQREHSLLVHINFVPHSTPKLLMSHIHQISHHLRKSYQTHSIGMIFAAHLSAKARQICRDEGAAYRDLSGNLRELTEYFDSENIRHAFTQWSAA